MLQLRGGGGLRGGCRGDCRLHGGWRRRWRRLHWALCVGRRRRRGPFKLVRAAASPWRWPLWGDNSTEPESGLSRMEPRPTRAKREGTLLSRWWFLTSQDHRNKAVFIPTPVKKEYKGVTHLSQPDTQLGSFNENNNNKDFILSL